MIAGHEYADLYSDLGPWGAAMSAATSVPGDAAGGDAADAGGADGHQPGGEAAALGRSSSDASGGGGGLSDSVGGGSGGHVDGGDGGGGPGEEGAGSGGGKAVDDAGGGAVVGGDDGDSGGGAVVVPVALRGTSVAVGGGQDAAGSRRRPRRGASSQRGSRGASRGQAGASASLVPVPMHEVAPIRLRLDGLPVLLRDGTGQDDGMESEHRASVGSGGAGAGDAGSVGSGGGVGGASVSDNVQKLFDDLHLEEIGVDSAAPSPQPSRKSTRSAVRSRAQSRAQSQWEDSVQTPTVPRGLEVPQIVRSGSLGPPVRAVRVAAHPETLVVEWSVPDTSEHNKLVHSYLVEVSPGNLRRLVRRYHVRKVTSSSLATEVGAAGISVATAQRLRVRCEGLDNGRAYCITIIPLERRLLPCGPAVCVFGTPMAVPLKLSLSAVPRGAEVLIMWEGSPTTYFRGPVTEVLVTAGSFERRVPQTGICKGSLVVPAPDSTTNFSVKITPYNDTGSGPSSSCDPYSRAVRPPLSPDMDLRGTRGPASPFDAVSPAPARVSTLSSQGDPLVLLSRHTSPQAVSPVSTSSPEGTPQLHTPLTGLGDDARVVLLERRLRHVQQQMNVVSSVVHDLLGLKKLAARTGLVNDDDHIGLLADQLDSFAASTAGSLESSTARSRIDGIESAVESLASHAEVLSDATTELGSLRGVLQRPPRRPQPQPSSDMRATQRVFKAGYRFSPLVAAAGGDGGDRSVSAPRSVSTAPSPHAVPTSRRHVGPDSEPGDMPANPSPRPTKRGEGRVDRGTKTSSDSATLSARERARMYGNSVSMQNRQRFVSGSPKRGRDASDVNGAAVATGDAATTPMLQSTSSSDVKVRVPGTVHSRALSYSETVKERNLRQREAPKRASPHPGGYRHTMLQPYDMREPVAAPTPQDIRKATPLGALRTVMAECWRLAGPGCFEEGMPPLLSAKFPVVVADGPVHPDWLKAPLARPNVTDEEIAHRTAILRRELEEPAATDAYFRIAMATALFGDFGPGTQRKYASLCSEYTELSLETQERMLWTAVRLLQRAPDFVNDRVFHLFEHLQGDKMTTGFTTPPASGLHIKDAIKIAPRERSGGEHVANMVAFFPHRFTALQIAAFIVQDRDAVECLLKLGANPFDDGTFVAPLVRDFYATADRLMAASKELVEELGAEDIPWSLGASLMGGHSGSWGSVCDDPLEPEESPLRSSAGGEADLDFVDQGAPTSFSPLLGGD